MFTFAFLLFSASAPFASIINSKVLFWINTTPSTIATNPNTKIPTIFATSPKVTSSVTKTFVNA